MNVELPRCFVFDFDIAHAEHDPRAWREAGLSAGRRVRIIAADEGSARRRLQQMYPGWRVCKLSQYEHRPALSHGLHHPTRPEPFQSV